MYFDEILFLGKIWPSQIENSYGPTADYEQRSTSGIGIPNQIPIPKFEIQGSDFQFRNSGFRIETLVSGMFYFRYKFGNLRLRFKVLQVRDSDFGGKMNYFGSISRNGALNPEVHSFDPES